MKNETKFPRNIRLASISDLFFDYYWANEVREWFQRCLDDYPNLVAILEAEQDIGMNRSFQALLCVNEWKVKWFSQFIEKGEDNEG